MNTYDEHNFSSASKPKSVIRRGAEDGTLMGILMSVIVVCVILTTRIPFLSLVSLILMIGVPILLYRLLNRGFKHGGVTASFSGTWMHGTALMFFGTLIMGLVMYGYLRFIEPEYIFTNLHNTVKILSDAGGENNIAAARRIAHMLETDDVPTAIECAFSTMIMVLTSGVLLAMIESAILTRRRKHKV